MPDIVTEDYTLPAHWAGYLINGDATGLSDEEQAECDAWLARERPGYCVGENGEPEFARANDANSLGCDVVVFTFQIIN